MILEAVIAEDAADTTGQTNSFLPGLIYPEMPEIILSHPPSDPSVMPEYNPDGTWTISSEIDDDFKLLGLAGWVVGGTLGLTVLGWTLDKLIR